jgi:hypothetical protein
MMQPAVMASTPPQAWKPDEGGYRAGQNRQPGQRGPEKRFPNLAMFYGFRLALGAVFSKIIE